MRRVRTPFILGMLLVAPLASACGQPADPAGTAPATPPSPADIPSTEPTVTTQPTEGPSVLTQDDDGATVDLAPGEEVSLRLASDWAWTDPLLDGAAVTLTRVDYFQDPGFVEWLVTATGTGTSTVTVRGEPACGDESACPPRTVRLELRVER